MNFDYMRVSPARDLMDVIGRDLGVVGLPVPRSKLPAAEFWGQFVQTVHETLDTADSVPATVAPT